MKRRVARVACVLAACVAGCASTPAHLYTLSPEVATSAAKQDPTLSTLAISVGPVSIPAIVDLQQIVLHSGANQVSIDEFNRWASPLRNNISLVVANDVANILGTSRASAVFSPDADYRVAIDVQGFDSSLGEAATLNALWTVRRVKDGRTETGRTLDREALSDRSYGALAAAHSHALGRMSADIADAIRALERSPQECQHAPCPPPAR
jgi:uncharacterized protein